MKRALLLSVASLALASPGISQQPPRTHESASASRKHVFVNGKPLPANQVIVKDGVSYVDASALAEALGATVQSEESGVIIRADQPTSPDFRRFPERSPAAAPATIARECSSPRQGGARPASPSEMKRLALAPRCRSSFAMLQEPRASGRTTWKRALQEGGSSQ